MISRRDVVKIGAAGVVVPMFGSLLTPVVSALQATPGVAPSANVPMFRGNAARTGEMPGPGPDDSNGVEVIWRFAVDDYRPALGRWFYSAPVLVNGVVYTASDDGSVLGNDDGHLSALNADDGTERWRFAIGGSSRASPAVVNGIAYVGSSDGNFYAVNAEDGTERWRFAIGGLSHSSPAVVDGVAYVGSDGGNFYAVNAEDGTERWRLAIADSSDSSPAVVDGVAYVGSDDGNLYAVNAEDGAERWQFTVGDLYRSSPAVVDGVAYVGSSNGNFYAVNVDDGTERWRFAIGGSRPVSPAVVGGVAYVGSSDSNLYAVNAEDGTERWRSAIPVFSSPAVVDGVVYLGSDDANLYAVNADDGTEKWRFALPGGGFTHGLKTSPSVVGGVAYIGNGDGYLYAIGARVPRLEAGGTARVTEMTSLRGGPAPTAVERGELVPDTVVTITDEAEMAGDVTWWPVTVDATGDQGWVEAAKLEALTSGPEPTPNPTATA